MSKHNRAFKIKLAQLVEEKNSEALGRKYRVSARLIRYWFQVYQINGSNSFIHKQLPYCSEFKIHVLKTMEMNNWSLGYTSAYFDLSSPGILFQWQKLYARKDISRLNPKNKGKPRVTKPWLKPERKKQRQNDSCRRAQGNI